MREPQAFIKYQRGSRKCKYLRIFNNLKWYHLGATIVRYKLAGSRKPDRKYVMVLRIDVDRSLLVRERGLKPNCDPLSVPGVRSLLVRERGLKQVLRL